MTKGRIDGYASLAVLTLFISSSAHAAAINVYISQTGAGDGSSCASAKSAGYFNTSANWGSSAAQIGPGTTVHLCGTISSTLTAQGSGASGNPMTIYFEAGAKLSQPVCPGRGSACLDISGRTYVTIDGGTNGIIESTANGTGLAHASGSYGIEASNCSNCEIKNLTVQNIYKRISTTDLSIDGSEARCMNFSGSNVLVHDNTCHDMGWALVNEFSNGMANIRVYNNTIYNIDHGWAPTAGFAGGSLGPVYFYNNHIHDYANWDSGAANAYHHDGIHCFSAQGTTGAHWNNVYIYNNLFDGATGGNITADIFLEGGTGSGATPCADSTSKFWIFNNLFAATTVINNGLIGAFTGSPSIFNNTFLGATSNDGLCLDVHTNGTADLRNNLMSGCNQLISADPANLPTPASLDYNAYVNCSTSFNCFWVGNTDTANFASYQSATGFDAHSVANIAAASGLNAAGVPQTGSIVISAGTNLTAQCAGDLAVLCQDKAGALRPASGAWDIGAYRTASVNGPLSNVYIAQNAAGAADGTSCGNAKAVSFFNTSGNWGAGAGQIGPGSTAHLCGAITTELTFRGSGSNGSVITLLFEPGASIRITPGCDANGCVNLGGNSYLLVDGGSNQPCGWNTRTNTSEGTCNGKIENMLYGSSGAACPGGACTTQAASDVGTLIQGSGGSTIEIRNLDAGPSYVHTASGNGGNDIGGTQGIVLTNVSHVNIHDNKLHDAGWHTVLAYTNGASSQWSITNNDLFNDGHMMAIAGGNSASLNDLTVSGNYCHDEVNWTTTSDAWHNNCIHIYGSDSTAASNITVNNNIMGGDPGATMTAQIFSEAQQSITNFKIFNNLIYWPTADEAGARLIALAMCTSGCAIVNNTLYGSGIADGTALSLGFLAYPTGSMVIENNIVANAFALFNVSGTAVTFAPLDYNAYGVDSGEMWDYNGTFYNVFSQWRAVSGEGAHSTFTPGGVSLNANYIPQSGSPAAGAGANLSSLGIAALNSDLAGHPRPASGAWDIGAYQSSGSPPSACDINGDGIPNALDVQLMANQALKIISCTSDINNDHNCDALDVQRVVNAALGGACVTTP